MYNNFCDVDFLYESLVVKHDLINEIGLEEAVLLSYLLKTHQLYEECIDLCPSENIHLTKELIKINCGISYRRQTIICFKLLEKGLINWYDHGLPLQRKYQLNFENIE